MRSEIALQIFNSMAPVFLLIFTGWLAVHKEVVGKQAKKVCSAMVSEFVFPALLFNETYKAKPAEVFNGKWILAFTIAMCLMWLLGYAVNKIILGKDIRASAMLAMLCSFPNMGGMGIPFLALLIGASSAISVAIANVIVAVTVIPVTLFLLELGATAVASESRATGMHIFTTAIVKALKKPIVFSVMLGLLFSVTGMSTHLPKFVISTFDIAAKSCNFVSLFAVGVAIYGVKLSLTRGFAVNLALKCAVNPVIVWALVMLFGLTGTRAEEMILLLAMPTATTATILAYQWNVQEQEASSLYMASTALSIFVLPALLVLMRLFIPGVV
ncbi:AEC family transporter [Caballeronia sp. SBC2]|uniref:AEC family transporter n=1 Tax=Caballeronia sp. SBC2 TaxID=2705547 RepID=UPI0013E1C91D|nr:AEC family transporter [Caballeronia sp. SBC2]QIE25456.1 Membrane transport protein [Caballeronia sp. SBC2]